MVFNKIDRTDRDTLAQVQRAYPDAIFISAIERLGLENLRQHLTEWVECEMGETKDASTRSSTTVTHQ